jgi:hypothetical protein
MANISPDSFRHKKQSLQEIAVDILRMPLDLPPKHASTKRTTLETCLQDSIEICGIEQDLDQLQQFGLSGYDKKARQLLELIQQIAAGKTELSHVESETLRQSLSIVFAEAKNRKAHYEDDLQDCHTPNSSLRKIMFNKSDDDIRSLASRGYYESKYLYDSLIIYIPPLLDELAEKLNISLIPPEIRL